MNGHENLYNLIGNNYNATRKADPYITHRLLTLLSPEQNRSYIDIGCGTGNYTIALSEFGFEFTGLDPSEAMLSVARQRFPSNDWVVGSAEKIPRTDGEYDGALATLTIHHWQDINKAFLEINRILKMNSRMVLFTSLPEQMAGFWLNHYFPKIMQASIQMMPALEQIKEAGRHMGFHIHYTELYDIRPDLEDHFLYSGKMNAALYLDEHFRKGISSFAETDNQRELRTGLKTLASDIGNGSIKMIQEKFQNNNGDYIFVVLKKVA